MHNACLDEPDNRVCVPCPLQLWTSKEIKPELLADKYWVPVLSALHKANLLTEVFALAPRLQSAVLLDNDAEVVLHHLIGASTTAECVVTPP